MNISHLEIIMNVWIDSSRTSWWTLWLTIIIMPTVSSYLQRNIFWNISTLITSTTLTLSYIFVIFSCIFLMSVVKTLAKNHSFTTSATFIKMRGSKEVWIKFCKKLITSPFFFEKIYHWTVCLSFLWNFATVM